MGALGYSFKKAQGASYGGSGIAHGVMARAAGGACPGIVCGVLGFGGAQRFFVVKLVFVAIIGSFLLISLFLLGSYNLHDSHHYFCFNCSNRFHYVSMLTFIYSFYLPIAIDCENFEEIVGLYNETYLLLFIILLLL